MKTRTLGRTGLEVSVLSYGASPLGGVFGAIDESAGIECVHTALDLGINLIDVSPYYGLTKAETVLGRALQTIDRDRYFLATKVGRYGENTFDFSAARVTKSVDESLARLGVDYVDIIQCHDIEFGGLQQIVHETLPALREVVQQGKARFVGITGLPLKIFSQVLAETEVDTILSYCRYSLNDQSLSELFPLLETGNIGVINASPLSMGLLTQRGAPDWHPAPREIQDACRRAAALCQEKGASLEKLALQFAVSNPHLATTLVGTSKAENIRQNIAWIGEPMDEELLREVLEIMAPIHNQTWRSGRDENNDF